MPAPTSPRDPARTLALLWGVATPGARGPQQSRTPAEVARAAVGLADAGTLEALSMRRVAAALGLGTMSLYTYVQNKDDLVDLVVDHAYGELYPQGAVPGDTWPERLREVARANVALVERHPWLLDVDLARPVLGPGETRKYDLELRAVDDVGLGDVEMDATVTLVVSHALAAARRARAARLVAETSGQTDDEWWEANAPVLEAIADMSTYTVAARVGSAAGEAQQAPYSASAELEFGLGRIIAGIEALLAHP
ncbi:TetR/AcrR family transcriptional regulator [Oerskovia flava]|uniref:TetR/AcrR family transcriptional regulator n=1 Tax=Oerskovia flava TaxID=2986422 RepID=UPI00223F54DA|nr:TetR/AcrR family transcriptional regulator [Oerskovia sp. JB1-3-2]